MKRILIILLFFVFISCEQVGTKDNETNTIGATNNLSKSDTIYKDDKTIIIKTKKSVDTLIKFYSNINDSLYVVKPEKIILNTKLDFTHYEYKKMFITATKEGVAEEGVNFAGHFCFVYWGCGSPCKLSAVVDMKTGKAYNGINSEIGYEFKKDSKLLIVNPPDSTGWYNKNEIWQHPSQYIWTGSKFIKL
jgi:hypothetical protein